MDTMVVTLVGLDVLDVVVDTRNGLDSMEHYQVGVAEDVLDVNEAGRPWECLEDVVNAVEMYLETGEDGFRVAVSGVVMKGGHATVTGCVTGAVLGILTGYTNLPKAWVENINGGVRRNLDKKLNNLFDLMGVP